MAARFGGRDSVLVIPRFATRVYFDVSRPLQLEMEHNSIYGPGCTGYNATGAVVDGGIKCNVTSQKVWCVGRWVGV